MEKPVCVVFADAFAYSSYIQLGGLGEEFSVQKIKPGMHIAVTFIIYFLMGKHQMMLDSLRIIVGKKPSTTILVK